MLAVDSLCVKPSIGVLITSILKDFIEGKNQQQ